MRRWLWGWGTAGIVAVCLGCGGSGNTAVAPDQPVPPPKNPPQSMTSAASATLP